MSHVGTFSGPVLLVFDLASIPRKENSNKNRGNTNVSEGLRKVIGDHKTGKIPLKHYPPSSNL